METIKASYTGGILLIVGTTMGAGMLALPLGLAQVGFYYSLLLLVGGWLTMYLGSRLLLEVNLKSPPGSHLVSMAKASFGWPGQLVAWATCLTLLYTLLASYIAGGSDVFKQVFAQWNMVLPDWLSALVFTVLFGGVVYAGIRTVDYVNRGLMFGKFGIYLILVALICPLIDVNQLQARGVASALSSSFMIVIPAFGFASLVPSLRYYFHDDAKALRSVLFWGSLIPLLCYVLWVVGLMGTLPRAALIQVAQTTHPIGGLIQTLELQHHSHFFSIGFSIFTVVCILTAFLGVALGLFDFLSDGLSLKKQGWQGRLLSLLTFLPPMLIVMADPGIYLAAFRYAGRCCVVLLLLLPACMAFKQRSHVHSKCTIDRVFGMLSVGWVIVVSGFLLYVG